jgi:transportin-1
MASISIAMGPAFGPYATPVFERCLKLVHGSLMQYQAFQANPALDEPEKAFLVVALDLLSGLVQGMGMQLEPLIGQSQMFELVTACLRHPRAPVRQSAYALVGDLAIGCFPLLRPFTGGVMNELVQQLEPEPRAEMVSASNNAAWSVGEIALRFGRGQSLRPRRTPAHSLTRRTADDAEFRGWVEPLLSRLIPILLHAKAPRSLHENSAVSIGRIGLMHPGLVAPHLAHFAQAWCQALYEIRDNEEKDSAFRGFCTLVQANPAGIRQVRSLTLPFRATDRFAEPAPQSLLWFCNAIVRWNTPSAELNNMFHHLLVGFKTQDPAMWATQVASFPPVIQERLATRYGV